MLRFDSLRDGGVLGEVGLRLRVELRLHSVKVAGADNFALVFKF